MSTWPSNEYYGNFLNEEFWINDIQSTIWMHGSPVVEQNNFRFRNDDGSESAATWKAVALVPVTVVSGHRFRLRFNLSETAGIATSTAFSPTLLVSKDGGAYVSISANVTSWSTSDFRCYQSPYIPTDTSTTEQLNGSRTFGGGSLTVDGTPIAAIFAGNTDREYEYVLHIRDKVTAGSTYDFRVVDINAQAITYVTTARATVVSASVSSQVTFVGGAAGTNSATMPTHQTGDLILVAGYNNASLTNVDIPTAYTTIYRNTANGQGLAIGYRLATSTGEVTGTWTNATKLIAAVYRGHKTSDPFGTVQVSSQPVNSNIGFFFTPLLENTSAESLNTYWGFQGVSINNISVAFTSAGVQNFPFRAGIADSGGTAVLWDSGPGAFTHWNVSTSTTSGVTDNWWTAQIEILTTIAPTGNTYENTLGFSVFSSAGFSAVLDVFPTLTVPILVSISTSTNVSVFNNVTIGTNTSLSLATNVSVYNDLTLGVNSSAAFAGGLDVSADFTGSINTSIGVANNLDAVGNVGLPVGSSMGTATNVSAYNDLSLLVNSSLALATNASVCNAATFPVNSSLSLATNVSVFNDLTFGTNTSATFAGGLDVFSTIQFDIFSSTSFVNTVDFVGAVGLSVGTSMGTATNVSAYNQLSLLANTSLALATLVSVCNAASFMTNTSLGVATNVSVCNAATFATNTSINFVNTLDIFPTVTIGQTITYDTSSALTAAATVEITYAVNTSMGTEATLDVFPTVTFGTSVSLSSATNADLFANVTIAANTSLGGAAAGDLVGVVSLGAVGSFDLATVASVCNAATFSTSILFDPTTNVSVYSTITFDVSVTDEWDQELWEWKAVTISVSQAWTTITGGSYTWNVLPAVSVSHAWVTVAGNANTWSALPAAAVSNAWTSVV